jgi:hypothetical protein
MLCFEHTTSIALNFHRNSLAESRAAAAAQPRRRGDRIRTEFAALRSVAIGTSRQFAASQQLGRFRSEADINFGWSRNRIYGYTP